MVKYVDIADLSGWSGLERIWSVLPEARLIGGSVRDMLCGRVVSDLDLATPEPPEDVQSRLEAVGIKVVPTGLSHGTVTAVIEGRPFEITTLRRDDETDGRHAVVSWTRDWREDAARRDFTINAMSCDRGGAVFDYFGGVDDLRARRVRFVGDAGRRIEEDALRVLRFFRFEARYGGEAPDGKALAAIEARVALLDRLSAERVASEVLRILVGPQVVRTVRQMEECGVLARIMDGARIDLLERLIACGGPEDAVLRLAALCEDGAAVGRRLRLSNVRVARLGAAVGPGVRPEASDDVLRRALVGDALPVLLDRTWLEQADLWGSASVEWDGVRARLAGMPRPVFPLTGKDAVAGGIKPGPEMGRVLRRVEGWWMAGGCVAGREACLAELRDVIAELSG